MFLEKNIHSEKFLQFDSFRKVVNETPRKSLRKIFLICLVVFIVILALPWTQSIQSKGVISSINPDQRPQKVNSIIPGRILKWYIQDGQQVNKGDTLLLLGEIKEDYLDESLLNRVTDQIEAKEEAVDFYKQKAVTSTQQEKALLTSLQLKKSQLRNKLKQYKLQVQSDSIAFEAANSQLAISDEQLKRQQQLYNAGLKSLTDLEQKQQYFQNALAKKMGAENKYYNGKNELINIQLDLSNAEQEYAEKISKINGEQFSALSQASSTNGEIAKLKNQLENYTQRRNFYVITAPQAGQVVRSAAAGIGEIIKDGETLLQIVPKNFDPAIEIEIDPMDMPLINLGQKVQLEFDGFPAIVFSGWPEASYGVFSGEISAIDQSIQASGKFRVWVKPVGNKPWPKQLKYGGGVRSIALLKDVPIIYELWRQLNGFPPEYYQPKKAVDSGKKGAKVEK